MHMVHANMSHGLRLRMLAINTRMTSPHRCRLVMLSV